MRCDSEKSLFCDFFLNYQNKETNKASLNIDITSLIKFIYAYFEVKSQPDLLTISGTKSRNTVVNWTNFIPGRVYDFMDSRNKPGGKSL